jgi:hypothetical protein
MIDSPDPRGTELRLLAAAVDRALGSEADRPSSDSLRTAWAAMVTALALGPEPELRPCPHCKRNGIPQASLCGYCWTKLTPPAIG